MARGRSTEPEPELNVIREASMLIGNLPAGDFMVAYDSMSSIQALLNQRLSTRRPNMLYLVNDMMYQLGRRRIMLAWVPTHCGESGIPWRRYCGNLPRLVTLRGCNKNRHIPPILPFYRPQSVHGHLARQIS